MTQGEIEKLTVKTQNIFSRLEIRIMQDIIRRIKENGFVTASADWQISRLKQLGESEQTIRQLIQDALGASDEELERIFSDEVYEEYYGQAHAYEIAGVQQIPDEENEALQRTVEAMKLQLRGEYQNLTGSMGFAIRGADGLIKYSPVMSFYRTTLDNAVADIHSGAFDYNTVLKRTVTALTNSGLRHIDYESGHRDRVDVAVRRAVLTGFRQVQGKINEQVAVELHTDMYEVTYHVGARPSHQPWQGRVWSMEQLQSVCGLGTGPGLKGWNCYHDYRPFPSGSIRTYTDEWLDAMTAKENTPKWYGDSEYTTYEALQQQRRMERTMRAQRQKIKLLKEGDADPKDILLAKARYQGQMQNYAKFSKCMDLPEQRQRIMQDGLRGRFMPTKKEQKALEESVRTAKIKAGMKLAGMRGEIDLTPTIPKVSKLSFDEHHINQERHHNVTEDEAKSYIQNALFSTTKWKGKFTNYYSAEGAAFVNNETQQIRTAFKKGQYDKETVAAMEVFKRGRT